MVGQWSRMRHRDDGAEAYVREAGGETFFISLGAGPVSGATAGWLRVHGITSNPTLGRVLNNGALDFDRADQLVNDHLGKGC